MYDNHNQMSFIFYQYKYHIDDYIWDTVQVTSQNTFKEDRGRFDSHTKSTYYMCTV